MPPLKVKEFDLNRFWDKTPTSLKYFIVVALIIGAAYFFVTRTVNKGQLKELDKLEQSISVTYELVDRFENYQQAQEEYNARIIDDLDKVYMLVKELNENVNTKFNIILKNSNNTELLDKLEILNESFEKLSKAYQPKDPTILYNTKINATKITK